jgi:thiopurine S-methyltransferase
MQREEWLARWESGQTGWHQQDGSSALRKFWPGIAAGSRVLVPLCGKSADLLWLAEQGCDVTGVELSEIAARAFFAEAHIPFTEHSYAGFRHFRGEEHNISIACGDYFEFQDEPFDALYDRAAFIALPPDLRPAYVRHTRQLLKPGAVQLLLTLEYDQSRAGGPPFAVMPDEVEGCWRGLRRIADRKDARNIPPKFLQAGVDEITEAVWLNASA